APPPAGCAARPPTPHPPAPRAPRATRRDARAPSPARLLRPALRRRALPGSGPGAAAGRGILCRAALQRRLHRVRLFPVYQAPKGTQDVLPEQIAAWRLVESACHRAARAFGYGELRTPTFEDTRVFLKGVGEATDIAEKEMYTFEDKGGTSLTLRPEGTAAVVRAYLEHGLHNRPQPVKLYTLMTAFRHDQPQAGRLREFHQWDAEAIGEADPLVDAELVMLLWRLLSDVGLRDLSVQLNSIGDAACRPEFIRALVAYFEAHLGELCPDCRRRLHTNPLRLLDCKNVTCQPVIAAAPRSIDYLCAACAARFARLRRYLDLVALPVTINPRLVRGLDYYTRTVFEVWPPRIGGQSTLGGGGRYDGLAELLGGRHTPGVGFAMGI